MALNLDPVFLINALLGVIIIAIGYLVYRSDKNRIALFIAIAYVFYFISNVMYLLGLDSAYGNVLIALRIVGYLTIIVGLYVSWKLIKTQLQALSAKNRQLEQEIAERKRLQELHRQAEEKYATILESALVAIGIAEEDLTISYGNAECEKILGYAKEEVEGKMRVTDLVDPRDRALLSDYHQARQANSASAPKTYELRLVAKSGTVKNVLLNIAVIPGTGRIVASFLDITERKKTEDRIKASLEEKEVLLKEVHHRVKNNLQIVSSLLSLQAGQIVDERDRELFRESQNRVKSMALIHEKLYQSQDMNRINLGEYVEEIISNLRKAYGSSADRVRFKVEASDASISLDKGIPCGLIVNELVTNCYKHAFPGDRRGTVEISVRLQGDQYVLTVSDDGVGLPAGFDQEKLSSLGIQLVSTLAAQLRGQMEISAVNGGGTRVAITFAS